MVGGGQGGHAIADRGVQHLALAALARLEHRADDAQRQHHAAAADIAQQMQGRGGRPVGMPHGAQRAGDGDVVQVMPRGLGQRTGLPPAGHAAVHQPGIARQADIRPQPQELHDAGTKPFYQCVRRLHQIQHDGGRVGLLDIQRQGAPPPVHDGAAPAQETRGLAVDPDDFGPQVGEHHGAERPRPDSSQFQYPQPVQWSWHVSPSIAYDSKNSARALSMIATLASKFFSMREVGPTTDMAVSWPPTYPAMPMANTPSLPSSLVK